MTAKKCVHDEKVIFVSIWTQGYQLRSLSSDAVSYCSGGSRVNYHFMVALKGLLQVHCTYLSALSRLPEQVGEVNEQMKALWIFKHFWIIFIFDYHMHKLMSAC